MKISVALAFALCMGVFASTASAGMIGTQVSLSLYQMTSSGPSLLTTLPSTTIVDPGVEFSFGGALTANFTDTGMTLHFALADWHTDELTFTFTDSTAGAFTGLSVTSNAFPAPNAANGPIATQPLFTNNGTVMSFSCCSQNLFYANADFTATFGPGSSSTVPEPATVALVGVGIAALGARRRW